MSGKSNTNILTTPDVDFKTVFEAMPGLSVLLAANAPVYTVLALTDEYLQSSGKAKEAVIGKGIFEAFQPDSDDFNDELYQNTKSSFNYVISEKKQHRIPVQRYVFENANGGFVEYYWQVTNKCVVNKEGDVIYIIHSVENITDQVRAEKDLAEKEQNIKLNAGKFETLLEAIPQMTWTNLPSGEVTFYNQQWYTYTGLSFAQLKDRGWQSITHPDDISQTMIDYAEALRSGNTFVNETRYKTSDGKYRWHLNRAFPVKNKEGEIIVWVGTATDIHDRRKAENTLRESKQRFQAAIAAVQGTVWTNSERGEMEGEQPGWALLTGQSYDEYKGYGWSKALHPEDAQPTIDAWNEAVSQCRTFVFEHRVYVKNLGWRNFSVRAIPLLNKDKSIREWVGLHTDITERKQAEQALLESDQRFQNLVREATVGIIVLIGEEMMVEIVNDAYSRLINRTHDELIKKPLFSIIPETEAYYRPILDKVRTTGESIYLYAQPYFVWVDGGKKEGYLNLVYQPYKEADGTITGVMVLCQDVTPKVTASKKVEESEQRIRSFVEGASFPIGVYTGKEMRVEFANQAILNAWGKGNDVIGKLYADILPELDNQHIFQQLDAVYTTGIPFHAKNQRVDLVVEGTLQAFYFNYSFTPLHDKSGNIYGVMNTAADVTDLNLAKQKIEESEKEFRQLADTLPELVWTTDNKGVQLFASKRWSEFTGLNPQDSDTFIRMVHPGDWDNIVQVWSSSLSSGTIYKTEVRLISKEGDYQWFYVNGEPIYNDKGEIEKWVGAFTNVNELKKAEESLRLTSDRFRLLADTMPQFVWMGDANGNLNYFNKAVYDYSGLSVQQIEQEGWLQIVHPGEREENVRQWIESVTTGKDFVFEHRFQRYDGAYRWQLSRAVPQRDASGNIQLWVGTSTDIHEIRELDEQKDYFMAMVSHELKTPITSVKGYVQILQQDYKESGDAFLSHSLKTVNKQIDKTTKLIADLLDVSKIKSGTLSFHKELFSINQLVQETVDEVKHINPSYQIHFFKEGDALLYADRERIGQVLTNLLTNAVKYSPDVKEIKVDSRTADSNVVVSVQDSGIGINKKDQQKIFERFYRVEGKNENKFSGFGIGLFIASEIIQKHQGNITVQSEPGEGSVFSFLLPVNTLSAS